MFEQTVMAFPSEGDCQSRCTIVRHCEGGQQDRQEIKSELKFFPVSCKMPAQTAKDNPMLLTLFGDQSLVKKYKDQKNPGKKIEMIWKTIFFQVKYLSAKIL